MLPRLLSIDPVPFEIDLSTLKASISTKVLIEIDNKTCIVILTFPSIDIYFFYLYKSRHIKYTIERAILNN